MEQSQQSKYKKAFRDIKNGFSEIKVLENLFYLKHLSLEDQVDIDQIYDVYFDQAKKRGVPTNSETLERLVDEKQWSKKQESLITQEQNLIENFNKQKKALYLKSEITRVNNDIESAQKRLNDLKNTRASFFQRTAESYAEERVNDYYILKCLYKDKKLTIYLNDIDVSEKIRGFKVSVNVSNYAKIPEIRNFVYKQLRKSVKSNSLVIDGRDIGTVVFPDATFKFFLSADPKIRAERRHKQINDKSVKLESIEEEIKSRDNTDSTRKIAPLKKADDAYEIDVTLLTIDQVFEKILHKINSK
jgi:cytidylate kinase